MLVPLYPASWKSWHAACIILALASLPAIFELPSRNHRSAHSLLNRPVTAERGICIGIVTPNTVLLGAWPARSSVDDARALSIDVQIAETAKNSRYVQD